MNRIKKLDVYTSSKLFKRLQEFSSDAEVRALITAVDTVAGRARDISSLVVRHMPQYTLHNERHFLNVLGLMDALIADRTLAAMTPLECALCLMAAYVHDLGMACSAERLAKINDPETEEGRAFASYCEQYHHELLHQQKRLSQGNAEESIKSQLLRGHMLAEYLRVGHTDDPGAVRQWLLKIARDCGNTNLFSYASYDYLDDLVLIAASHGHGVDWLRVQFDPRKEGDFLTPVHNGEGRTNRAFPGLLLRLADLMDFDASRAPSILFHHIAIEHHVSVAEWQKHMAISAIYLAEGKDEPVFSITAQCPSPVIHKNILAFASSIERELSAVRGELSSQRRHDERYDLVLPARVDCGKVKPARNQATGQPLYHYEDLDFRLNQEEIMELLMGENLYDQPWLCIRELLQNAMDALELREMRLSLDKESGEPGRRADILPDGEEFQACLRWGHDAALDQDWLEVEDNGVGMTFDVVRKFFTQIGKSFYRSPDYLAERKQFEDHKLPPTSPTSQFGIGILSCFMLADRLDVVTDPGRCAEPHNGVDGDLNYPLEIRISGPGSLFWITPPARTVRRKQGTRIRLYLKNKFQIDHDAEGLLDRLSKDFGYLKKERLDYNLQVTTVPGVVQCFDPAREALRHCVWPKYPLRIEPPSGQGKPIVAREDGQGPHVFDPHAEVITGASFHGTVLRQPLLNVKKMIEVAGKLGFPPEAVGNPHWAWWDFVDAAPEDGSGSRFRLWYLRHDDRLAPCPPVLANPDGHLIPLSHLAVLATRSGLPLPQDLNLISGMHVEDTRILTVQWEAVGHVGGAVWRDWRGATMPRLKADRSAAKPPVEVDSWRASCRNLFARAAGKLAAQGEGLEADFTVACRTLIAWKEHHRQLFPCGPFETKRLIANPDTDWPILSLSLISDRDCARALDRALHPTFDLDLALDLGLDRDHALALALAFDGDLARGRALALALDGDLARARAFAFARALARPCARSLNGDLDLALARDGDRDRDLDLDLARARACKVTPWVVALRLHWLSEMLQPALEDSLPQIKCFGLCGRAGDLRLLGPAVIGHNPVIPGNYDDPRVVYAEATPWLPWRLAEAEYDLVFPLSAIPLGGLRHKSADWREDRRLRPLGTYVFHDPEAANDLAESQDQLIDLFQVEQILALLPHERLYGKTWEEWTEDDWADPGLSALWDIRAGWVKWVWGLATAKEIRERGVALDDLPSRKEPGHRASSGDRKITPHSAFRVPHSPPPVAG